MNNKLHLSHDDWASASDEYDKLLERVGVANLSSVSEAQTRYDIIDKLIRDVLGWKSGQVEVEKYVQGVKKEYVDYYLSVGDSSLLIEAKRIGAAFPSPTKRSRLKLSGSVLGTGEIAKAIAQAIEYAENKGADVVCVTNGACWCFFSMRERNNTAFATLLFPFSNPDDAERLFNYLSEVKVASGSLSEITNHQPTPEDRLISVVRNADARLNRNNIAGYIAPALNLALQADALADNSDALERCFVPTEGRTKFDRTLGVHLTDSKPHLIKPAQRIKTRKKHGQLEQMVQGGVDHSSPVTLILGSVGSGKSTYLKHFQLVSGKDVLESTKTQWIYIDFERMGAGGNARQFIYEQLKGYLLSLRPEDVAGEDIRKEAYRKDEEDLIIGPLAPVANLKDEFNKRFTDYIMDDFNKVEPYVEKVFKYLSSKYLCVIILDNVDLSNDESLELMVLSEGIALSKKIHCNILVSLRDTTYVKYRNDPTFNAYELRKLWLDPPPFRSVLSKRLTYSRKILENKSCVIPMENGSFKLKVPNLAVFFDIVQRSILSSQAGDFIENMADVNIRQGLSLVNNFLTSGHIQADRALKMYLTEGKTNYEFPFHEVFKGSTLSQWKFYREDRTECVNLYDSRLGSKRTRLLRFMLISFLSRRAMHENTVEVSIDECIEKFYSYGATSKEVLDAMDFLTSQGLIKVPSANKVATGERVAITRTGAYYLKQLSHTFVYAEQCMHDTAIQDSDVWERMYELTLKVETSTTPSLRMKARVDRMDVFLNYLVHLAYVATEDRNSDEYKAVVSMAKDIEKDAHQALKQAEYWEMRT